MINYFEQQFGWFGLNSLEERSDQLKSQKKLIFGFDRLNETLVDQPRRERNIDHRDGCRPSTWERVVNDWYFHATKSNAQRRRSSRPCSRWMCRNVHENSAIPWYRSVNNARGADARKSDTSVRTDATSRIPKGDRWRIFSDEGIFTGRAEKSKPIALRYFKKWARGINASLEESSRSVADVRVLDLLTRWETVQRIISMDWSFLGRCNRTLRSPCSESIAMPDWRIRCNANRCCTDTRSYRRSVQRS